MKKNEYLYLDHAATTPMRDVAFEAYKKTEIEAFANSAGGHALSRKAKNILEDSRDNIAGHFGAAPKEITFTSGGTEADNWIIKMPFINNKNKSAELVTSEIEHEAVLASAEWVESLGYKVNLVPCDSRGVIDTKDVLEAVNSNTEIVSIMLANNETGIIQPVKEIAQGLKALNSKPIFHSDVVQAVATTKLDFHNLGIQSAAISGHKIGGPKGIGIMFLSSEVKLPSFLHGGKQELERRAGTVNVSGVASLSAALDEQQKNMISQNRKIHNERKEFEEILKNSQDIIVLGEDVDRLEHISNIQFKGINSETLMVSLDLQGLGVSRGSACASGAQKPSHVLQAMKISSDVINSHLRFSFGWNSKKGDGIHAAEVVMASIEGMK
ncbi:MAG: cysteine desulfurase NifS [Actinobacteria bacterium]|nr:cysteine desulfurase NifS [Actinomycetota bacterium]